VAPDIYRPGIDKVGAKTGVRVAILEAVPAPPSEEDNAWRLLVTDANGEPVNDAKIVVIRTMKHGDSTHGDPRPMQVSPLSTPGEYQIEEMWLNMPGLWKITIELRAEDGQTAVDSVDFSFCAVDR